MSGPLLDGKTAVITGGSSGNGRSIAEAYAAEGADIVVADIQEAPREGGTPTHELVIDEYDVDATYVECNVTNLDDLEAAVDAADEFGGIDVMVNNAGIFRQETFVDTDEDAFDQMMDINVKGVYFGAQYAARKMVENGGGSIINMSSNAGLEGSAGFVTYCTSKGAVRLMTYALADELGPENIRVNAIHPGAIETAMLKEDVEIVGTEAEEGYRQTIPLRRLGQPEDVADAALYLASDLASYVSGESLYVDGGMTNSG
ncbi:SDR family oxidoreductase [Halorubrum ezzemoulense]|uniref:SDR family oxidoreductase n=1 Tax=Halorubrum ezzemoulense TaxID=337243 RepID=UPI00232C36DE|nr:SDR family oxidoreductase [Halorubrum ezzemoulense]MDB9250451.1 SDR family oxidoreductase [Halorubrum ezzemoulense]MDB9253879.1 SDR family oxidoreductase [Halorubrum ezzemoulense]MDB9257030.1 SDR family oxidoreductase [Halorubrum ezzemoulense]MDB9260952.1 SDR family oxidoreductase [Halorubrum ezzemoulense]MDB9264158.1 SDR family oxidoreductase [Halorubrum ezzemoulense]